MHKPEEDAPETRTPDPASQPEVDAGAPPFPLPRYTRSARAARALRADIFDGTLAPGAMVPTEKQLAVRFRTNRNTIREALRTLQAQDLITVRQGARARVRDFRREGELPLLPAFLEHARQPHELAELLGDMLLLRAHLLEEAAALACVRGSREDGTALMAAARAQRAAAGDAAATVRGDLDFHRTLVAATHSLVLRWTFNTIVRLLESILAALPGLFAVPPDSHDTLARIAAAVVARKAGSARSLVRRHLRTTDERLLRLSQKSGRRS